jgi:phosphopantothenoylcysteine decarboxylase
MANIILGLTGSVATIKAPELAKALRDAGHEVKIIATKSAMYFLPYTDALGGKIYQDEDEWQHLNYERGDDVMHIEFRKWADAMIIAPLSANTLAKVAYGMSDNFLTCVARAWGGEKPLLIAPAMNTAMWEDPITNEQIELMRRRYNLKVIDPISKKLACGDIGKGAMASVETIVEAIKTAK